MSDCWVSDCRIALEMGFRSVRGSFTSGRAQKPHTSPRTPAPELKKIHTGRVKHKHSARCPERKEHGRVSGVMRGTGHGLQEREKEREIGGWASVKGCEAGYETNNCRELRVRWRGLRALGERGQNMSVPQAGVANMTGLIQDRERERDGESKTRRVSL